MRKKCICQIILAILLFSLAVLPPLSFLVKAFSLEFVSSDIESQITEGQLPEVSDTLKSKVEDHLQGFIGGFLENKGQGNSAIHYSTQSSQMAIHFGTSEITLIINNPSSKILSNENSLEEQCVQTTIISLNFLGCNKVVPVAESPTGVFSHYFVGSDQADWSVNNQYYTRLVYPDLYENIDLIYEIKNGQLKYEFFVYPGGAIEDIRLHWAGPVSLDLQDQGMVVNVNQNDGQELYSFVDTTPVLYQCSTRETSLSGFFEIIDPTTYGFSVPSYDPTRLLIIDPVFLTYSTYVSGSEDDYGKSIAVDVSGNVYVTGLTLSVDFPVVNAYNATGDGSTGYRDVFVFKLSSDGSSLLYSTYVGGNHHDNGNSIAVDVSGNVYVAGDTQSTDFPTVNAYNATGDGNPSYSDVFVFKLSSDGSSLHYSTYVNGSNHDYGYSIAVDVSGNAYVAGITFSVDFPTVNAYNATGDGNPIYSDVFVFKLSSDGSSLLYSTYVNGSNHDNGNSIAVDISGNAYVAGNTQSTDFPTVNAYNATGDGTTTRDVFIFKLSSDGSNLLYSTYVGGDGHDYGHDVALDTSGNAYVTGETQSTDFPTVNAYNATGDGNPSYYDAFVFRLSSDGSSLLYSTYVSGSHHDIGYSIAVDVSGNVYVTGQTYSTDFPTTFNALDKVGDESTNRDVIVFKLSSDGSSLLYSTYVSGSEDDYGNNIALDASGNAYVVGDTDSADFPVVNAYNATGDGSTSEYDAFVFKLSFYYQPTAPRWLSGSSDGLKVTLDWHEPNKNGNSPITGYRVYRNTTSGTFTSFLIETTKKTFVDSTVINGTTYYYVVSAINNFGESVFSNEVSISVLEPGSSTVTNTVTNTVTTTVTTTTPDLIYIAASGVVGLVLGVLIITILRRRR